MGAHVEHAGHGHDHGHHHHEESWVSKYIFSMDHKMISKQFLITAIVMGVIAVMLSVFSVSNWDGQVKNLKSSTHSWETNGPRMEFWIKMPTSPW